VTSSAGEAGVKDHSNGLDGVAETPEEETEDEDLDDTVLAVKATQSKSQQPRATPQLSNQRSLVIQETPTAARVNGVTAYPNNTQMEMEIDQPKLLEQTTDSTDQVEVEPYSTARTGQSQIKEKITAEANQSRDNAVDSPEGAASGTDDTSIQTKGGRSKRDPKVVVHSKKRPSPPMDEEPNSDDEPKERSTKRARRTAPSDNDTQDSRLSNIVVDTSPAPAPSTAKKGRKRKSVVKEIEELTETTPSRSQRSSQRSISAPTAEPYSGDAPCVSTSNSSITDKSQAVKFLKKQGGSLVESGKESFNVLW
jgi:hypothetical protein